MDAEVHEGHESLGGIAVRPVTRKHRGKPDPAILADIVRRIVRAAKPEKIVLFGSAARGEMGPDSDYDVLVIKGGKYNHWRMLETIHRGLRGKDAAVDVVLATPEVIERYRHSFCLVYCPAMEEGKVIYESNTLSSRRPARVAQPGPQQSGTRRRPGSRRVS
jgi:predicted nucleotidyltransferase